jgi:hypothetical protein
MLQICDMGQTALLPLQRKVCWGFFWLGLNPQYWVPEASTLTTRPWKPLTWQVTWHFFLQKFLVWNCVILLNVSETLFFSNRPIKRNYKPTDQTNRLAMKCRHKCCPFLETSLKLNARWTADLRSMFLLDGVLTWTYSKLSLHSFSQGCPSTT